LRRTLHESAGHLRDGQPSARRSSMIGSLSLAMRGIMTVAMLVFATASPGRA
jgi:hypothetical protein